MSYTPGDIFRAIGRQWLCDDDFRYSLNPNDRYSAHSITTMQREWEWRAQCLSSCVGQCQSQELRVPKQRAKLMKRNTPQQLEVALFRAREEENRMRLRLWRHSLAEDAKMYAEAGDYLRARQYRTMSASGDYDSDSFMSDEE